MKPTVWVMTRDASMSGVPIATLRLLRWARRTIEADFYVIMLHGGALMHQLDDASTGLVCLEPDDRHDRGSVFVKAARSMQPRLGTELRHAHWRRQLSSLPDPDVVLAQGAGGIALLNAAPTGAPTVIHLHEGTLGLRRSLPTEAHRSALRRAAAIMVADESCIAPAREIGRTDREMCTIPGVVDPASDPVRPATIAGDVVVGMGTPGWRKGTDRFVAVAHGVRDERASAVFQWIGGEPTDHWRDALDDEPAPVDFHPSSSQPWDATTAGIAFVPSREDPMPLVALEAGQRHLALVAADVGGLKALLGTDRGCIVPGHDLRAARNVIIDLMADPTRRYDLGEALADYVNDRFNVEQVGPEWWSVLAHAIGS